MKPLSATVIMIIYRVYVALCLWLSKAYAAVVLLELVGKISGMNLTLKGFESSFLPVLTLEERKKQASKKAFGIFKIKTFAVWKDISLSISFLAFIKKTNKKS